MSLSFSLELSSTNLNSLGNQQKLKAIIIDDESLARKVLINLITRHFPEIEIIATACNCEEGISVILTNVPDVVFLDVEMPDGTAFDLLQKTQNLSFKTILTTAYSIYQEKANQHRISDFLLKPISRLDLKNVVDKLLIE